VCKLDGWRLVGDLDSLWFGLAKTHQYFGFDTVIYGLECDMSVPGSLGGAA